MSANERQVGGEHYKTEGEQHWDRMYRMFGPGYFVGCITKYVERYQRKNGYEDLQKAQHFLEKLIELEGMKPKAVPEPAPMSFEQMSSLLDDLTVMDKGGQPRSLNNASLRMEEQVSKIAPAPSSSLQVSGQRWKRRAGLPLNGMWEFQCTVCGGHQCARTVEEASAAHGACAQAHGYTQQG